ncbi:MAG: hypothetical protein OXI54_13950 [Chloroflexota bacterium]|nr:hypothetical protein [Chloroflexota bacterium]MDE2685230.1 hypothetical protein [Chloroflexota bacterium]
MISFNPRPSDSILLVEGSNDKHVIKHLAERFDPNLEFAIKDYGGIDGVLANIRDHIDEPGRPAVGIVVDADAVQLQSWRRVCDEIASAERNISPIPPAPDPQGTIISENPGNGDPRVGIWVMPDNISLGELEGFIARMIPAGDMIWPLSRRYIDQIPLAVRPFASTLAQVAQNKILGAQVHAWLATRADPRPMGLAIGANDLDTNVPVTQTFLRWLANLFR